MHKCYKEGETQFLMYLQKLFHSIHCAYRNPQAKFGVDTFIYKRDWSHFHISKLGVFVPTIARSRSCIKLFFSKLLNCF